MMNGPQDWINQGIQQIRGEIQQSLNQFAGGIRGDVAKRLQASDDRLKALGQIAQAMTTERSGTYAEARAGIVRIEDLPGRRVPFDFICDIPIGSNTTSLRDNSITISQEGPFVAVARYATFQSAFEFQTKDPDSGAIASFSGRSFGRYRPIHSAWDLFDAGVPGQGIQQEPIGPVTNAIIEVPGTMSGFRTMEFDGRILVENAGSSYPRQNISVPSSMWTPQINAPQNLGALDFFERGEVITFRVQPTHINNPLGGNADGFDILGSAGFPFLAGQFDRHEGIVTPNLVVDGDFTAPDTDPVVRLPDGILTIGFLGYRILQPVGPVG